MTFEGGEGDEAAAGLAPIRPARDNRWYDYVPLVLIGASLLVALAEGIASLLTDQRDALPLSVPEASSLDWLPEVGTWTGLVGWIALLCLYFVLAARKQVSGCWCLSNSLDGV